MKRRNFIKSMGALGATVAAPSIFHNSSFIKSANAAPAINEANFVAPAVLPQVINIFLYGGPSELAGNLTNIGDINANSQNPYTAVETDILLEDNPGGTGQITRNGFWRDAGGSQMEDMLAAGDLTVYRTINRRKNNTRAHRPSILSSQKGNLDIEISGGVGTTIASVLYANKAVIDGTPLLGGRPLEELVLPFVSFEGESSAFSPDAGASNVQLPLQLRGISLDQNFDNPYTRGSGIGNSADIDAIVSKIAPATNTRFGKVSDGFTNRASLETKVARFSTNLNDPALLPLIADVNDPDRDATSGRLVYPGNNRYTDRVKAAVTLAMQNTDSLYISVGGGLGGWDDHDNSIERYKDRMTDLMTVLRVAAKHIRLGQRLDENGVATGVPTDNIVINVHGDFGRNVNLNGSMGWDHGNNQNLYTVGGSALRPAGALGKVVGSTQRFGSSGQNRQFTEPTSSSYEAEPMSIASTVYTYFGVQNPEVLTTDPEMNPGGDPAIDETVAGEPTLF
ncbi:MAG: DUF1501 domain-containing protein [Gammaproteobacteria bacterium]|nr:DUF1501 domain-containing protein [Gammaproteobacteria bacterium]